MAANAPYYQMRTGQFINTSKSTNATPPPIIPEDDEYEPSAADIASPLELGAVSFSEHTVPPTSKDTLVNISEENHNLVELLEAATTAASQTAQTMEGHDAVASATAVHGIRGRKRAPITQADDADDLRRDAVSDDKRRRVDMPMDPELQSTEHNSYGNTKSVEVPPAGDSSTSDARAAGVHSAAALFRRTTENTTPRKYTRPPMSKLFVSLQLSPENFLHLQAQAKMYMLDTRYPERQNCVGNRSKGDTDMVKLRLFNCVRDFLRDGAGEQFFGENVEKLGEHDAIEAARALGEDLETNAGTKFIWPKDGNTIISLVTPLMRRMVTNERQRMYAIETRKGSAKKKDKGGSAEVIVQHDSHSLSGQSNCEDSAEKHSAHALDPSLGQVPRHPRAASPMAVMPVTPSQAPIAKMTRLDKTVGNKTSTVADLPLPTDGLVTSRLSNINIFLVVSPNTIPSGAVKPSIKLGEKRIFSEPLTHLTGFTWDSLLWEVYQLLIAAKAKYPAVRDCVVAQNHRSNSVPTTTAVPNNFTDNLRELAAAANAMQSDNVISSVETPPKKPMSTNNSGDPSILPPLHDSIPASQPPSSPSPTLLPRYVIKTIGPSGWEHIQDTEQWKDLLSRRSLEIWADGVVNIMVDLVDVSISQERQVSEGGEANAVQEVKDGSHPGDPTDENATLGAKN